MAFLHDMRAEFRVDLAKINTKLNEMNDSIDSLKEENVKLKEENKILWKEMKNLKSKVDKLESYFRRNNLKIRGLEGSQDEKWSETEGKVRSFIRDDSRLPEMENVEIERTHRLKSADREKCVIIMKFNKVKDKEAILQRAKECLKNSDLSVQEDFTERVMFCRKELGKRLVAERARGNYAAINYDKLIVNNTIYGYYEGNQTIVEIGKARNRPRIRVGGASGERDISKEGACTGTQRLVENGDVGTRDKMIE